MAEQTPERFCEHQTRYNPQDRKYHCAFGDWQCASPLCFYATPKEIPEKGCSVANKEGKLAKAIIGGLAEAGLLP